MFIRTDFDFNAYLKYFIQYFTMVFWLKKTIRKKKQTNIYDLRDLSVCVCVSSIFFIAVATKINCGIQNATNAWFDDYT